MAKAEYTCIVCPVGCRVTVEETADGLKVTGNTCKKGEAHAIAEFTNPVRMLTTTVKLNNGHYPRIPVISEKEVPKNLLRKCLSELYKIEVEAPLKCGDVIVENICGTGVNILAARTMDKL